MAKLAKKKFKRKEGQTLVEFALVSIFFIFMLFLTINVMIAFAVHQYVSYAVFMSARAYQAAADNPRQQKENALRTLKNYLPGITDVGNNLDVPLSFQGFGTRALAVVKTVNIPPAVKGKFGPGAESDDNFLHVVFDVPILAFPIGNIGRGLEFVELQAKSFLGREVTTKECKEFFQAFLGAYAKGLPSFNLNEYWPNMEDNGC